MTDRRARCSWAEGKALDERYHDTEWGVPVFTDADLFEALTLEGAQAGLSWSTILKKREGYRAAFRGFDPTLVASFGTADVDRLVEDAGIVRHRGKIESTVNNAQRVLEVQSELGSFASYIWDFVDGKPIQNAFEALSELPSTTPLATQLSKDLKKRGFRFVGPTTVYAFMQAVGMVNDHVRSCFRYVEIKDLGGRSIPP